ncbi:hypothetical protein GCM10017707_40740 [Paenarthrobacter aurescens]
MPRHFGIRTAENVPHIQRGQHVQGEQVTDSIWMIQTCPHGNQRPTVMAGKCEAAVPQNPGGCYNIGSHGPL